MLRVSIVLFVLACTTAHAQPTKEFRLPSGKIVNVVAVGQMNFSNGSPALMLKYQTDLKITDAVALRKEVDEIWATFRPDVEHAKLRNAIVSATEKPQGTLLKTANGYNFVFIKQEDGSWRLADDEPRQKLNDAEKKHP